MPELLEVLPRFGLVGMLGKRSFGRADHRRVQHAIRPRDAPCKLRHCRSPEIRRNGRRRKPKAAVPSPNQAMLLAEFVQQRPGRGGVEGRVGHQNLDIAAQQDRAVDLGLNAAVEHTAWCG